MVNVLSIEMERNFWSELIEGFAAEMPTERQYTWPEDDVIFHVVPWYRMLLRRKAGLNRSREFKVMQLNTSQDWTNCHGAWKKKVNFHLYCVYCAMDYPNWIHPNLYSCMGISMSLLQLTMECDTHTCYPECDHQKNKRQACQTSFISVQESNWASAKNSFSTLRPTA